MFTNNLTMDTSLFIHQCHMHQRIINVEIKRLKLSTSNHCALGIRSIDFFVIDFFFAAVFVFCLIESYLETVMCAKRTCTCLTFLPFNL